MPGEQAGSSAKGQAIWVTDTSCVSVSVVVTQVCMFSKLIELVPYDRCVLLSVGYSLASRFVLWVLISEAARRPSSLTAFHP